jgi:hypothetical protein
MQSTPETIDDEDRPRFHANLESNDDSANVDISFSQENTETPHQHEEDVK